MGVGVPLTCNRQKPEMLLNILQGRDSHPTTHLSTLQCSRVEAEKLPCRNPLSSQDCVPVGTHPPGSLLLPSPCPGAFPVPPELAIISEKL